ncbi:hypothetical protein PVAP13_2KG035500 [Panicum virgatum]|uniref:Uncharacterized protein n=1 Tax=Panicum virgatum TaxID=38727 RepID=A0A8T0W5J1_PANVG|nr:hypothetical protein PVAP13_2KG035500 [Panicum virgatum]
MALRALIGKLRGAPAEAASRAFSTTCEYCGKTSSRIAGSLGQKNGAIKDDFSEEFKKFQRKQYIIRTAVVVTSLSMSWLTWTVGIAYIEDNAKIRSRK